MQEKTMLIYMNSQKKKNEKNTSLFSLSKYYCKPKMGHGQWNKYDMVKLKIGYLTSSKRLARTESNF